MFQVKPHFQEYNYKGYLSFNNNNILYTIALNVHFPIFEYTYVQ